MTKDNATPRPWKVIENDVVVDSKTGQYICRCEWMMPGDEANARLIVKAVNCHDELVEALQSVVKGYYSEKGNTTMSILYEKAKQALEKAGEA